MAEVMIMEQEKYSNETIAIMFYLMEMEITERLKKSNKEYAKMLEQIHEINEKWDLHEMFCEEPLTGVELSIEMVSAIKEYIDLTKKCNRMVAMAIYKQGHFDCTTYLTGLFNKEI